MIKLIFTQIKELIHFFIIFFYIWKWQIISNQKEMLWKEACQRYQNLSEEAKENKQKSLRKILKLNWRGKRKKR